MRIIGNTKRKEVTKCIEKNLTKLFIQNLEPKITGFFQNILNATSQKIVNKWKFSS